MPKGRLHEPVNVVGRCRPGLLAAATCHATVNTSTAWITRAAHMLLLDSRA